MFVLLSAATPSRLLNAFPPGVRISRVPLDVAIERVRSRLSTDPALGHQSADVRAGEGLE
jgi:ATP-dependent DNA helicase DinG